MTNTHDWPPWVRRYSYLAPVGIATFTLAEFAENTTARSIILVLGLIFAVLAHFGNAARRRWVSSLFYGLAAVVGIIGLGTMLLSEPLTDGPADREASSPTGPTTTTPTTTTPTTTTSTELPPTTTNPPPPPRQAEEQTIAVGEVADFFGGDLTVGVSASDTGNKTIYLTTNVSCSAYLEIGRIAHQPGTVDGHDAWFRVMLLASPPESITVRAEELPEEEWPYRRTLMSNGCPL